MIKYKKISNSAFVPRKSHLSSAGIDLHSAYDYLVSGNGKQLILTDLAMELPEGTYGRIAPRLGLALNSHLSVGGGVIDPDYRGNIAIILFNHGRETFRVKRGDRVAQLICEKFVNPTEILECPNLEDTERGESGFGSTGISNKDAKTTETSGSSSSPSTTTDNTTWSDAVPMDGNTTTQVIAKKLSSLTTEELPPRAELEYILDLEGFFDTTEGNFVVKEYAFICVQSDEVAETFFVNPPYPMERLSAQKNFAVRARSLFYHGVDWNFGELTGEEVYTLLRIKIQESSDLYAYGDDRCAIFSKIFQRPVKNLKNLRCPDSSKIKLFYGKLPLECKHASHRLLDEEGELKYECAYNRAQKYCSWYRKMLKRRYNEEIFPNRLIKKKGLFCCYLRCFDRYDNTTEVDGLACDRCEAYSRCHCTCKTYMFAKTTPTLSEVTQYVPK